MTHHPSASRYDNGLCRRDCCRTLASRATRERRWRRFAERVLVDGRLVAVRPGLRHGEPNTYKSWGCRCEPCTAANRRVMAEYREYCRGC